MTAQQMIKRLKEVREEIQNELPARLEAAVLDLSALIQQRIVQTGESAEGATFTPYSDTPLPAFFYKDKSRSSSAEAAVTALETEDELLSYKEFRVLNGLKGSPKNFEFTGEMWRGVVVAPDQSGALASLIIKGGNPTSADRLRWGSGLEKTNLLRPSKAEADLAESALNAWVREKLASI